MCEKNRLTTDSPSGPDVSVVVPTYDRRESILKLLGDIYIQQDVTFEAIVIDDNSSDETAAAIKARYPRTLVVRNNENMGPAIARNQGVRLARGKIIVGLDNDVRVPDRLLLKRTLDVFQSTTHVCGVAFRILAPDGLSDDYLRWWHPLPITSYAGRRFVTDYFSGTGYAFRRRSLLKAGLFSEVLFMHYEEVELAYRVMDRDGQIMYCPELKVVHHAGPTPRRNLVRVFYKPRNQILLALLCYSWHQALIYLVPRLALNVTRAILRHHTADLRRALISAWQLAPQALRRRKPLRKSTWRRIKTLRKVH